MTTAPAAAASASAPPSHDFDEDDELNDYIDNHDDFFDGNDMIPPSSSSSAWNQNPTNILGGQQASSNHHHDYVDDNDEYEQAMLNEMLMLEQEQFKSHQNKEQTSMMDSADGNDNDEREDIRSNNGNNPKDDNGPAAPPPPTTTTINNEDEEHQDQRPMYQSVEEYLAYNRKENQLYGFERYTKNTDWRDNSAPSKQKESSSIKSSKSMSLLMSRIAASKTKKPMAADAHFLQLLQTRNTSSIANTKPITLRTSSVKNGILKFPKENTPTISMTLSDGTRVYVKKTTTQGKETGNKSKASIGRLSCSLGVNIKELIRRVDMMKRRSIMTSQHGSQQQNNTTNILDAGPTTKNNNDDVDSSLWVDKHAPVSFPHLLSDERINREVLRALRMWDPYVFGKKQPSRPTSYTLYKQQQQQQKGGGGGETMDNTATTNTNSLDKRPEENQRVILLSGPPGVGKTTLAHIVARHAGYRPLEVNASDERSAPVLTDRIQRAMESTTIAFSNKNSRNNDYGKPNCLILDEIDGADAKGAINALVDIVKAEIPSSKAKNQKSSTPYLRRPIICICNHKYAPTLRPLLPYAVHFNVDPPLTARLVARLKSILNKEKLSMMAGGSLLHQLVVSTGGDIRSCLFTLQFAAIEKAHQNTNNDNNDLSQALMNSLNGSGLKDDRNDIASTVSTVFRKMKSKAGLENVATGSSAIKSKDRVAVARVIDSIEGLGDDSAAINAMFMNIINVSYIDPAFDRCSAAHELLSSADLGFNSGYHSMQRICTPATAAGIHLLCRVEVKPKLNFSNRELSDVSYRQDSNQALIQKFSDGLPTKAKNYKCQNLLSTEFIPMVLWILSGGGEGTNSPLCRAASSFDILTKTEQEMALNHVSILCALGLTYIPDTEQQFHHHKSSFRNDVTTMRLEPPIHRLGQYNYLRNMPHGYKRKELPSKMKELLAYQVRLSSFRIVEQRELDEAVISNDVPMHMEETSMKLTTTETKLKSTPAKVTPRKLDQIAASASLPDAKRVKTTPSPTAHNFLGIAAKKGKAAKSARRAAALGLLGKTTSSKQKLSHTGSGFLLSQVVRFKHVKGFTQAVRTPCRLQDLE